MKRILAAVLCTLTLSLAVGSAAANNLSLGAQQIRAVWNSLELSNPVNETVLRCPVILEGSFHSATMVKRLNLKIGYIARANVADGACTNGHARIYSETLPWSIWYEGFFGTLPRITGIKIWLIGMRLQIEVGGNTCETTTEAENAAVAIIELNATTGENVGIRAEERTGLRLRGSEVGICALASGRFRGMSAPLVEPDPPISIRLI